MNRPFIHDDFLLENAPARHLYHQHAAHQPIIDFHNHLSVAQIASNHQFGDLTELWLSGDHYKWRAMRANGVAEQFITGNATPEEKFKAWAATVPYTLRNPLHHWTHLELVRNFGITRFLNDQTSPDIWRETQDLLPQRRVHDLLELHHVEVLCTTDDPADSLEWHQDIAKSSLRTKVYPTYRPDKAVQIDRPVVFNRWVERLEQVAAMAIRNLDDLLQALKKRHDDFQAIGCRLSDHGLTACPASPCSHAKASRIFKFIRDGAIADPSDQSAYASFLMLEFGRWNAARDWVQQLHIGAQRNNNSRFFQALGPDSGFDSIGDIPQAQALASYLDALDVTNQLPRTILYNLNPADNYVFAAMAGNFQEGNRPGKVQLGSGWWFLDQKEAIEWQLNTLSNMGLLRRFVGMVTDSRSFLSFTRHEYFRRVLCNLLGQGMVRGELPDDFALIGSMVEEICCTNARNYLGYPTVARPSAL